MDMDMKHGHGYAAWKWICSIDSDMQQELEKAVWTWRCSMDLENWHRHGKDMDIDMAMLANRARFFGLGFFHRSTLYGPEISRLNGFSFLFCVC
jgi:hypothetical protein